ncbi:MAG TPA: amino acid adenylation domain-containing protein [Mycobacteriales bacterium]|nr:amino acid adenylation domain-containing protein [Mycobacteriales bacterium]
MRAPTTSDFTRATRKEEALWLLETIAPGTAANNLSVAFAVDGRLSHPALRQAVRTLVRRYDVLRTVYLATRSELAKKVLGPDDCQVEVEQGEISSEADLTGYVARPFRMDGRPLIRVGVYRLGDQDVCCVTLHHLIFDTRSGATLLSALVEAYDGYTRGSEPAAGPPVPAFTEPAPTAESLAFWRERLAGVDPAALALDFGVPEVAAPTLTGDRILHTLSAEAVGVVRGLGRELRAPEAVVLLAAYLLLLAAHGAGPDLVVGVPVDTRPSGATGVIGYHVNVLPLRMTVDPAATFRTLVRATREVFFDSLLHADVPVDNLSADLSRTGSSWRDLLFRHLFNYVAGLGLDGFTIGGMDARPIMVENGYSKFDLEFFVLSSPEDIWIRAVYGTEFLGRDEVAGLLARYETLLVRLGTGAVVDTPVQGIEVWSDRDRHLVDTVNRTAGPVEPERVLDAVRDQVTASPDAVAVVHGDRSLTYGQLWAAAWVTRRMLADAGVRPGEVVAVAGRRGPELAAAVLGTWLAGAAYLPLDPQHPGARVAFQLADSGARVVLTDGVAAVPAADHTVLEFPPVGAEPATSPDPMDPVDPVDPASPAYLIYTSGSTGTPKGTLIAHRSLANLIGHFAGELSATPRDATLWLTTFAFDISALELFVPLATGGRVVVAPDEARMDGRVLLDLLDRHRVGIIQATPTTWRVVLDRVAGILGDRRVLVGGEPVPPDLARRLLDAGCELHHVYGPTETTIWSTSGRVRALPGQRLDIGRPIANTRLMVLDPGGRGLPPGVRGELCIGGAGVAIGYHDRPELTADRFREHPVHGRYYRTGDIARWRGDGTVELFGRGDRQIKLRGNRIELGEIEAAIRRHPAVTAAAVVVVGDPSADAVLVAFVQAGQDGVDLNGSLREHSRVELPRAAVPHEWVLLDALPTNASQKVDYPALARFAEARRAAGRTEGGPATHHDPTVALLIGLWRQLLERDDVDAHTDFFDHGGHSLLGALLVQLIEETTGVGVALADLFSEPTPARLAGRLSEIEEAM